MSKEETTLKELLRKIRKTLVDGLTGMRDSVLIILKKDKKKDEEETELEWWEDKPEDKKAKKPTIRDRIKNIRNKFTMGPKPFPGSRRLKRTIAALSLIVYIGIIIFMVGENMFVEIFFILTVYILIDYLAITREVDIWRDEK